MREKLKNKDRAIIKRGILGSVVGRIANLVITKKGFIFVQPNRDGKHK